MKILLIFCFAFSSFAIVHWPREIKEVVGRYRFPFEDGKVGSVWGTCNAPNAQKDISPRLTLKIGLENDFYTEGQFEGIFHLHTDFDLKPRDLVVVIPGAFSNMDNSAARRLGRNLFQLGHNTVQFSNPWGSQIIDIGPTYQPGDFETEALAMYQAIKKALIKMKSVGLQIRTIRVIGISYGAFVSAILSYLDASSDFPFLKDFTLISPPYQMGDSLDLLDKAMDDYADYYKFYNIIGYPITALKICGAKVQDDLSNRQLDIARYLSVYAGFHGNLVAFLRAYDKNNDLGIVPDRKLGFWSHSYRQWKKELRFTNYLEAYSPEVLNKLRGPKGYIGYWIDKTLDLDTKKIRILAAEDDFINAPGVWPKSDPSIVLLKDGGHFGFRGLRWFDELLEVAYRQEDFKFRYPD